ncbi:FAD-dependent oxidoreductase [Paraglaciecola chathamensis]|jgi:predicted NAD/FAD-binding protein|uniref:FAD-dependent oxidoreductase n=1 Tax=Paraglaciecola chathamensis TaxID=368405 RepID=A0ABS0W7T0_9ALTE|nr:FAD-dependent oxidoreductase [Paraglaciecola chathamensis]MBJ2134837.1 FAD-dependent oxidoreductase [Paraglaciecola chathamensis]
MSKRIAIIGSGISGLTCGHLLHKNHDITIYEANDYVGGHTATKDVTIKGRDYAIDTGFIVYNDWTYPHFIKLMNKLGVKSQPTEMSFSVKNETQNLEYNGNTINSLFAQRRNIVRPLFWRIVKDILRFNKLCKSQNVDALPQQQNLFGFLTEHRFSDAFIYNYILPMCAAIWSTSVEDIKAFPFKFFLRFFNNHGLLNITDRPQWYTLIGGSREYIAPLTEGFEKKIMLNAAITSVAKTEQGYQVNSALGSKVFDEVIFACHSDQALAMLDNQDIPQRETIKHILGAIKYIPNEVVLHTDESVLPKRKLAWASWNYSICDAQNAHLSPAVLTYNMNILQCIDSSTTFCVTLNDRQSINDKDILGVYHYAHPQFNDDAIEAQARRSEISGVAGLHFCGAYWFNGFHEDGVRSALDVCQHFGESL